MDNSTKTDTGIPWSQVPNVLTLLRIGMIPLFVVAMYLPFAGARTIAAFVFFLAGVTDWLDGYLARKMGLTSRFGEFLDPVADKLMVAVALVIIVQKDQTAPMAIAAAVIIGREITISALREWMAEVGEKVKVSYVGKTKTLIQMAAILCLIYQHDIADFPVYTLGQILLLVAVALTMWSMFLYLKAAWETLQRNGGGSS